MKKFLARVILAVVASVMVVGMPVSTYSLSQADLLEFSQSDILFYDPHGCGSTPTPGAYNGNTSEGFEDLQAAFVDTYHDIAATLSIEYGIPWETVIAQGILESASGTSRFARERNNFFGIAAFDSDPNKAYSFGTPEEGWRGYYQNIQRTATYRNHGVFTGENITNPYVYAQTIKDSGYASDPNYVSKLHNIIKKVEARAAVNGWESSAQLAASHPEMLENAARNAEGANLDGTYIATTAICSQYGSGVLVAGGMTLDEAKAFMEEYRSVTPRSYGQGGDEVLSSLGIGNVSNDVSNGGCVSDMENCVAFSRYFICVYAKVCYGKNKAIGDGANVAKTLIDSGKGFVDGGNTPRLYAIFSKSGGVGHTGVVLGIDTERKKIITGEADCYRGLEAVTAYEHDLSTFSGTDYRYAYTDGLIGF